MKDFFLLKVWDKNVGSYYTREHIIHGKIRYLGPEFMEFVQLNKTTQSQKGKRSEQRSHKGG